MELFKTEFSHVNFCSINPDDMSNIAIVSPNKLDDMPFPADLPKRAEPAEPASASSLGRVDVMALGGTNGDIPNICARGMQMDREPGPFLVFLCDSCTGCSTVN